MKIVVPIKRVVDPYAKVRPLPDGSGLDLAGVKFDINPFDEIAMEEAVRMKERDGATVITALGIGGPECEEQLRKALAIGADEAVLVEADPAALDPSVVAAELAAFAQAAGPDMLLMGKQATDDDSNQAGQMAAELLGWPQATFACKVEPGPGHVLVTRETDTGEEVLKLPLPCVVTVDLRLNEPRYIALPGIIKARSKPLRTQPRATSAQPRVRLLSVAAPPGRAPGKRVGSVDELLAELRARSLV
jgi:electron transfer flavoprotein beta subunit